MKIRSGFVSNSSSSSFLVIFPREPKSAEDVRTILFDENQTMYGYYDDDYTVQQVSETVWSDICNQTPNDIQAAKEELEGYDSIGSPEYDDFKHLPKDEVWDAYNCALKIYAGKKMKEFFNLRKLKLQKINNESVESGVLYIFEFSDNDGSYNSALEHGDLFNKVKHIRISKH